MSVSVEKKAGESPVQFHYQWCKKCGICVTFCPTGCLEFNEDGYPYAAHPEKCVHCENCDRLCPDFAISGAKVKDSKESK